MIFSVSLIGSVEEATGKNETCITVSVLVRLCLSRKWP